MKNKKLIQLMDTRGNFSLAIRMPTKDYKARPNPKPKDKSELQKEKNRQKVKNFYKNHPEKLKESREYTRIWKLNNPDKVKEYARRYYLKKKQKQKQHDLQQ